MISVRSFIDPDTGEMRTEVVEVPAASADVAALREQIQSATSVADLKGAMLDVLDIAAPAPAPE